MIRTGLGDWPRERSRTSPDHIAVIDDSRECTYAEFSSRVDALAVALASIGVERGDRVAYLGPNRIELVEAFFATCSIGAIFVPLNYRLASDELAYIVEDADVAVLIRDADCEAPSHHSVREIPTYTVVSARAGGHEYSSDRGYEGLLGSTSRSEPSDVDPFQAGQDVYDQPCLIQYTSGTTGMPKGVILTHANVIWNCLNIIIDNDLTCRDVTLIASPLIHTSALNATFLPTFLKAGTAVLHGQFDAAAVLKAIETHSVTFMSGVPAMFRTMSISPTWNDADLSSLRVIVCAGETAPPVVIESYLDRGVSFVQGYGMTEASPAVTMMRAGDSGRKAGTSGRPCFFTEVRVVDAAANVVGPGVIGEVQVRGLNVTPGYWNNPVATSSAFTADGWFRSGDAGMFDVDGYLSVVDRYKDMFISGGENIYPAEVERVILSHPAVAECAVVAVESEQWGEVGCAYVVCQPGRSVSLTEVNEFLEDRLARYKHPKQLVVMDAMPTNASGKILKKQLENVVVVQGDVNGDGDAVGRGRDRRTEEADRAAYRRQ